jgi:hypothetical protein
VLSCVVALIQAIALGASTMTLPWDAFVLIGAIVIVMGCMRAWVAWTGDLGLVSLAWLTLASDAVLAALASVHVWVLEEAPLMQSVSAGLLVVAGVDALMGLAIVAAARSADRSWQSSRIGMSSRGQAHGFERGVVSTKNSEDPCALLSSWPRQPSASS